jgi:predicted dehydrogenase
MVGANDRIQVGFIGYGLIGRQHVHDFKNQKDADLAAMCEVCQPRLEEGLAACGPGAKPYQDFRKLLDDKDIQAVVVCTPDHWHALLTIMACAAGKDVYVEKPLTLFVKEGRWMTTAARRYRRIVQVGTQQRSGRPYNPHRALYHFRWSWDYSGGQMTNLGAHDIDIVQWSMGVAGPQAVSSSGGRFALEDNGETPDTQDSVFEYPGFTAVHSMREASAGRRAGYGLEFFGTKGSMTVSRAGYEVFPDMKIDPTNAIPVFEGQPAGGPQHSAAKPEPWIDARKEPGSSPQQFDLHARNFLDCVKSRELPISDVEQGHRTAVACHLANISLRLGRKIHWDAEKEEIIGDGEASAMLARPYREPWGEVLRSFHL